MLSKYPNEIQNVVRRKLRMINNAFNLQDLRIPPANRLEKLKGDLVDIHPDYYFLKELSGHAKKYRNECC